MLITQVEKQADRWSHKPNSHSGLAAHATHAHRDVVVVTPRWLEPALSALLSLVHSQSPLPLCRHCLDPLRWRKWCSPNYCGYGVPSSSLPHLPFQNTSENEVNVRTGNRKELWSPGLGEGKVWDFLKLFEIIKNGIQGAVFSFRSKAFTYESGSAEIRP